MDEDEIFGNEELRSYADQLARLFYENAPKRDDDAYPHEIKWHGIVVSPFPGNLKQNGTQIISAGDGYAVLHGYDPAPYALYANATSRKPQYIETTIEKFKGFLTSLEWEEV